ncbi:hypothetical protein HUT19_42035 (plasmid) [Streptomyces sp. NA02950]|uniref:hypothetical protein n=1 Tax=Streptomyces sp. NA02950 TaxID=2742137 RepID=UPI0015929411|nr:hypothetical protein [Streptomyces sp. NA02950]QKV98298.1 hypothetical protein HUT19_42035 [Streptomyces sp. NA02950]
MDPQLERVPPPKLNGRQMACVDAKFALTETPAIAHFAAVHHHLDQILRTVAVNDRDDWIQRNIDRARRDLNTLEMALQAGELPDLTERDSPTRWKTSFEGIPAGLRQPLDASRGTRDFSAAYRPVARQRISSRFANHLLAVIGAVLILSYFANRT